MRRSDRLTYYYRSYKMLRRLVKRYNTYMTNRVAYYQLMNMNDKQLNDIGICRGDIRRLTGF